MAAAPSPWSTSTPWTTPSRRSPAPPTGRPCSTYASPRARPRPSPVSRRCQPARGPSSASSTPACAASSPSRASPAASSPSTRASSSRSWSRHAARRRHQAGHAPRGGADPPARAAHVDVDLRRQLSRPHHQAAGRARHRGDRRQPAPPRCRVHVDAPARRPPRLGGRRAADDAPDRARRRADLRLPARGRRPPRARLVLLVPRPPDGPHRPQQLARPAGHVHRHRPAHARR